MKIRTSSKTGISSAKNKISSIPPEDLPRERIENLGPGSLSTHELVAAIIGTGTRNGNVMGISREIVSIGGLEGLAGMSVSDLKRVSGISNAKSCQIVAAIELGKRLSSPRKSGSGPIRSASEIADMFMSRLSFLKKEVLYSVSISSSLRPSGEDMISAGDHNTNSVCPAEVFRPAISRNAAAIILVHNHPSGDPSPSSNDISVTKSLCKAGSLLGIDVLDHIIIGNGSYSSMKEQDLI